MMHLDMDKKLYVITESAISNGRTNEFVVREAIKGGAEIIQLREKLWSREKVRDEAKRLLKICRNNNVLFILNDYVDIALEIEADGVHLGQEDMPISEARKISNNHLIIGISTHSLEQAINADKLADYITIGPIFKTRAKNFSIGTNIISEVASAVKKPLIAIGGININNLSEILKKGARNVAVISAVVSAEDIKNETEKLVKRINRSIYENH